MHDGGRRLRRLAVVAVKVVKHSQPVVHARGEEAARAVGRELDRVDGRVVGKDAESLLEGLAHVP